MIEDIKWALDDLAVRVPDYALAHAYYHGDHRLDYIPSDYRTEFAALLRRLRLNLCPAVVDALKDRLKIASFTTGTDADRIVLDIQKRNRFKQRASEVHNESLTCGDSYLIVWPNASGEAILYPQRADLCTVLYDEDDPTMIVRAAKVWKVESGEDKDKIRVTLYYPERLEKYISTKKADKSTTFKAADFIPLESDTEDAEMPNPFGQVPVFHFGNRAAVGGFGKSELAEVIPLQDALNKMFRDVMVTGDLHSLPQRFATGIQPMFDDRGRPVNQFIAGDFWQTASKEAAFGQLPAAELEPFIKVKDSFKIDIATVSGTPLHHFYLTGGTFPSGESQKTAEGRLTAKAYDRMVGFGAVWEAAMQFAYRVERGQDVQMDAVWENTESRSDNDTINNAATALEKGGGSRRQFWRERGYSDEEINDIFAEAASEDVIPVVMQ